MTQPFMVVEITGKVSFNIARYVYVLSGQLAVKQCYQTRQFWQKNNGKIQMRHFEIKLWFDFVPESTFDLSGNTVWPHASAFQKNRQNDHFLNFWWTFVRLKCKRSSFPRNVEWDFFCDFQTMCSIFWFVLYGAIKMP